MSAPALADPLIVVAGPSTGRHAAALAAMVEGARRGLDGRAIRISDVDDGCDAQRAEGAARVIVAERPDLVVGHPCPAAAIAAAKVYAAAGVLFIALGVRHPDLTDKRAGPTIFRLAGRDDRQGQAAAETLLALAPRGPTAIVPDRTAYARGLTAAIVAEFASRKLPPPVIVPIVAGRRDYDLELRKLATSPPQGIFFAGYPSEAAVVLRGLRKVGLATVLVASDANATDEFAATVATGNLVVTPVKVMVPAPGSGGYDAAELREAAVRAVTAWLAAMDMGLANDVPARLAMPVTLGAPSRVQFDSRGDSLVASFAAVPLIAGQWRGSARAGP